MTRLDPHRPSAIVPDDYEYVGCEVLKIEGLGDAEILRWHREQIQEHMKRTGGRYSHHEHGGNCGVCGSVNAIYTILFWHRPTNSYVRVGQDCAEKLDMGGTAEINSFRAALQDALQAQAGKRKAQALLADAGLIEAWPIYEWFWSDEGWHGCECGCPCRCYVNWQREYREESQIADVVGSVVKYGHLSDKQAQFLRTLLQRLAERPARLAAEAVAREAAADCPSGRIEVAGEVLAIKVEEDGMYGPVTRMLVRAEGGWKTWGSRCGNAERGDRIRFRATLTPSSKDSKFGYFKRPVLVTIERKTGMMVEMAS